MIFRDLSNGNTVFMLNRDKLVYCENKVVSVGMPKIDNACGHPDMVVDITLDDGKTYTVKDGNEVAYAGNLMISPNRENMLREVDCIQKTAEQMLANIDQTRKTIEDCKILRFELDPAAKKELETEVRFTKLEDSLGEIGTKIEQLLQRMPHSMP